MIQWNDESTKMEKLNSFYENYLKCYCLKSNHNASDYDKYMAISNTLSARVIDNWMATHRKFATENPRSVYYISLEYNLGSPIKMHSHSAHLEKEFEHIKKYARISECELLKREPSVELGNYLHGDYTTNVLEALASQGIHSIAYGLWYDMAQYKQSENTPGQVEKPYYWATLPHPWVVRDHECKRPVCFGGDVIEENAVGGDDRKYTWRCEDVIMASSFDYPLSGYRNGFTNTLRFWNASPSSEFNSDYLHHNDYIRACDDKINSTRFIRYLFNDETFRQTSELHIQQQYFLASASIKDIIYRHAVLQKNPIDTIAEKAQIFLADCRCGLAIIEFVCILVHDYDIPIIKALKLAEEIFVVSMPLYDSMEFQSVPLYIFETMLPLHTKIIMEMNHMLLEKARLKYGISDDERREMSLIEEGAMKKVRMANLLLLFSRKVFTYSDDAARHINSLVCPNTSRFFNIDITPALSSVSLRRWLVYTNANLAGLITSKIGSEWINDNKKLAKFEKFTGDIAAQNKYEEIKFIAKKKFFKDMGIEFSDNFLTEALLIVHSRKIAIANSQILMLFYIACRYIRIIEGEDLIPRVYLFAGRAMPTDIYGKQIFTLINTFTRALQNNPKLQVHFAYNRNASVDEKFLAVGDLSEYISSPVTLEAPAFNIFRCATNGVITLTGTNEAEASVAAKLGDGTTFSYGDPNADINAYDVNSTIENNPILNKAFDLICRWIKDFSGGEEEERRIYPYLSNLRSRDEMKMFMFFDDYCRIHDKIDAAYKNKNKWLAMVLRNIARAGAGSIDDAVSSLLVSSKEGYKW